MVLFIPVKYEIKTSTPGGLDNLSFHANAKWFLKLFWAFADYREKQFVWQVRLLWKCWNQEAKDEEDSKEEEKTKPVPKEKVETSEEQNTTCPEAVTRGKRKRNKQNIFTKFKCTIKKIYDKIKKAWNMQKQIIQFLKDDTHQEAYRILKKEFMILIKHLRPRTLKGTLRFGMEDPYNTGRILAVLSALYPFYGDKIQIYPDFENQVLEGDVHIKGRMHLITMVIVLLRLFFNKEIRKTYQDYETIMSNYMGGN